ncbi:hypothetical protein AJ80_03160 [Polytolypa hystricis UAMH7299]|uniref:3-dehydrosphinganine reductase n=1 Tax=Polytolypa hystricis (strain UAMH7299) TaxID=1447883 RepID=A0A2B7YKW6_POLH7|nr:hypothetical protein AJ80_03160 [Polytolypa hystricis UAMH7299]
MLGFTVKNYFPVKGRTAVVTGGSEGMGRSVAIELSRRGANVVIVARNVNKLKAAIELIKAAALDPQNQKFHFVSADLRDANENDRVQEEVTKFNGGIPPDVVWCCAGLCLPGFFINISPQTLSDQMETVYWTAAYTAHATLRRWLTPTVKNEHPDKSPARHLIFTGSTASFVPITGYGPYSPAKAAMRALADTLAQEVEVYNGARRNPENLAPSADVKIHMVFPMGILSPGYENETKMKPELTKILEEADKPQTPEEVAEISIRALERGEYMITTMLVGTFMKASAMGSSPRNYMIRDTLYSWLSSIVFLQVIPDLRNKAWKWGKRNGVPK